jgi:fatty-acyl-CoA synthase
VRNGDIAAIAVPGENQEETAAVLVQCRLRDVEERRSFSADLKAQILEATGVNCRIELIPPRTLPRTSSGKLSRAKARSQFLSGGLSALAQ